ncbi:MAG: Flp pilus assembly protein CpaB [Alphaproteobacteria bacterium]|nr:Flp pilus assembly protein CpaB [Alphaproteobacteria bacterium]
MPARKLALLFVALIIAGGTIVLARSMMKESGGHVTGPAPVAVETDEVLVSARDLPAGTLIKETDLKWQPWPRGAAENGFAVKGKNDIQEFVGGVVRQGLRTGEPVMTGRVVKSHDQGFMAAVLNPGMRAVSVPVTPTGGVAGFIFPGDHVDVIVTHQITRKTNADPGGHKVSETVLTNARVLALDQRADDQTMEPKVAHTATLEVTPKQAETLALVNEIGTLSLSLRSLAQGMDEPPGINDSVLEAAQQAIGAGGAVKTGMTWDSDVSNVLVKPGNRQGAVQHIQIMRGKETSETVFELRQ